MSRVKRFTVSLATGYLMLGATVLQTLASVPIALHYLPKEEFGLWALVTQISGYLLLIDLGMAGSISRILIDYKDHPADGAYGSIIKTGMLVLLVQGVIIAVGGGVVSLWLPQIFAVPLQYRHVFQVLVAGQCGVIGVTLVGRITGHVLQAHQRYDVANYAQISGVLAGFLAMWAAFANGLGLYSLLAGSAAQQVVANVLSFVGTLKLGLFPVTENRGHANMGTFRELFSYAREIFLLSVGVQLVSASQVIIISRTLGLTAAATWSIATKTFMLAQQVVFRPLDFSGPALSEMMVRGETERLRTRFRDLVILSASLAIWASFSVGLCNEGFLKIWTKGRIAWGWQSDCLIAVLVIINTVTRCYIGFTGLTKDIRGMKYIYPLEGVAFVVSSFLAAPVWGINGILICAMVTNILCSGVYGLNRTKEYFGLERLGSLLGWLRRPLCYLVALALIFAAVWCVDRPLGVLLRLSINASLALLFGAVLFWKLGLSRQLRMEAVNRFLR